MISIFNGKEQWDARLNLTESIIKPGEKNKNAGFQARYLFVF